LKRTFTKSKAVWEEIGSYRHSIQRGIDISLPEKALRICDTGRKIDFIRAVEQHNRLTSVLVSLGLNVETLPSDGFADSVFIEDTAIIIHQLAFITIPGAESRRSEVLSVKAALSGGRYKTTLESVTCQEAGTLDGGDVLFTGEILIAISDTN
jgi:dimethylargininase